MARAAKKKDPLLNSTVDSEDFSAPLDIDSTSPLTRRDAAKLRHVSLKQLATLLNRDRNTIMKYLDDNMPFVEKADRDRGVQWVLDVAECVRWLEQRAAQNVSAKLGDKNLPPIDVIEQRTKAAKMYTMETEAAEAISIVARIHDILSLIKADYSELRARLTPVGDDVSAKFTGPTADKVKRLVDEKIASALKVLKADAKVEKLQDRATDKEA